MNILDKEEFRIKLEEINRLVEQKNYKDAMEVVDSIDWRRVKNVHTLCVVGEIYAANKRYDDSREIFLLAYHRAPIGRNILYRLIEVSLKMKDIDEAMEYYDEFLEVAPNDSTQYVKYVRQSRLRSKSRSEFLRTTKKRNLRKDGHMSWQNYIIRMEIPRSVWISVMRWFSGSVTVNMS